MPFAPGPVKFPNQQQWGMPPQITHGPQLPHPLQHPPPPPPFRPTPAVSNSSPYKECRSSYRDEDDVPDSRVDINEFYQEQLWDREPWAAWGSVKYPECRICVGQRWGWFLHGFDVLAFMV